MLALAGAGSATLPAEITATPHTSTPCPPPAGRQFCIVLSTYDGVSRDGGLRVDLQLLNYDQNTLTNPIIDLSWLPYGEAAWIEPKPSACSLLDNPNTPTAGDKLISCAFANLRGIGGTGTPPIPSEKLSLYFDVDVTAGLTWHADAFLNEAGHDPAKVPNTDVRFVDASQGFDDNAADNQAISFGAPGATVELGSLSLGSSKLGFTVPANPNITPFQARFAADATTAFCFGGLACAPLQLSAAVGTTGLQVWSFTFTTNLQPKNVKIIHRYDKLQVTSIAGSKFQSSVSYVGSDGVKLTNLSGLGTLAEGDYYVVNATATTFQIALKAGGKPITVPAGGTADAARIRIIGDQDTERAASCSAADLGVNVPSMFAESVSKTEVKGCLGDNTNGSIGPGG